MRLSHALLVCTLGLAVCFTVLVLQQFPPTVHSPHPARLPQADNRPKRPSSARYYQSPVERPTDDPASALGIIQPLMLLSWQLRRASKTMSSAFVDGSALLLQNEVSTADERTLARSLSTQPPPGWPSALYYDPASPPVEFRRWNASATALCSSSYVDSSDDTGKGSSSSSRFIGYANLFAELRNVVVDRNYCRSDRKGGEPIDDVVGQNESVEYYRVEPGCFRLACDGPPKPYYDFVGDAHLSVWMKSGVKFVGSSDRITLPADEVDGGTGSLEKEETVLDGFTIAVVRYEYANLYHTTTDWYNAFVVAQFFGRTPAETNILLVDAHPFGALDSVWTRLFGSVTRLSALGRRTRFRRLVWNIVGYDSPMKTSALTPVPPLFDAFRRHVLASYSIDDESKQRRRLDCSAPTVLFIWRRDYVAHPRNPVGRVQRKFANEVELVDAVRRRRPTFGVDGVQIDLLDVGDQLRRVVDADIVVGVHGAGLTHAAFMRRDAALAELSPNRNEHFEAIAAWRRLAYARWTNNDSTLVDREAGTLRVPATVVNGIVDRLIRRICRGGTYGAVAADVGVK